MKKHWLYLKYIVRHKWFVFRAGLKIGVPLWQLIVHDWSKFLPSEWVPYTDYFYGKYPSRKEMVVRGGAITAFRWRDMGGKFAEDVERDFYYAWNLHQKRHPHHWQFWLLTNDRGDTVALEMPEHYVREMVADWKGAGLAQGKPDTKSWYLKNRNIIQLHPVTRNRVEELLGV